MAWFGFEMSLRCILLFTVLVTLVLSDQLSEENSHCTADSCDENAEERVSEEPKEERDSGVHLAYNCAEPKFVPEEEVPVIMLHGLTDIRKTWDGIYQNIATLTHRKVCVYDARNHGDSGWNDTFNVDVMAEDIGSFMNKLKIERAVLVGHSMGGLTAMKFALNNPSKVDRLFVEDISPIGVPEHAATFVDAWFQLLRSSISSVPEGADEITAKKRVADYLQQVMQGSVPPHFVNDAPITQRDGLWQWKANLDLLYRRFKNPETFFVKYEGQYDGMTFFIYGKASPFAVDDHKEDIEKIFPNSEFFGVEGAGHIIHSVHSEFLTELIKFLE